MKRSLKIIVISVLLIFVILGLAIILAEPVLNSTTIKSRIENIVGETLDMSFKIEGKIELDFLPFLSVAANKIKIRTSQGKIASADRIETDPRLPDLFFLKVHLDDVRIHNPQLTFDPHALDKIIALTGARSDEPLPVESLVIESFSISHARFYYSDGQTVVDIDNMNLDGGLIAIIENRKVIIGDVVSLFRTVNFKGEVSAQQVSSQEFKLSNIKAQVKDQKGILTFDPLELEYIGSEAKLRATLDLSKEKPILKSQVSISGMSIGALAQKFSLNQKITGKVNVTANISAGPIDIDQILEVSPGNDREDASAPNLTYPVKSFTIGEFTIAANDVVYSEGKTTVDIPRLNLTGDRLTIIEDNRLQINDLKSLIASTDCKVDTVIKRIFATGHDIREVRISFKVEQEILTADAIHMNYLGSNTKIAGGLDLSRKMPNAKIRIESVASDLKSLAVRILPGVDISGSLKVNADITAADVQVNKLIERLQAISRADRPAEEEVFPVSKVVIESIRASAGNLKFAKDTTKLDNAQIELTGRRLPVIEKNKLTIKDFDALWRKARFDANIQIDKLSVGSEKFDNIRSVIHGDRGSLKSDLIELDYFGARATIAGALNMQDNLNRLKVRIKMPQVDLKKSFEDSEKVDIIEGMINIQAEFEARAAFFNEILKNMNGNFSIKGRNLILKGVDLDKALDEFKKMRGYGFNDLSALILLGPLGTVVSQGYDQLEALEKIMKSTGNSTIEQVVSDWNVAAGVVTTKEVAFSTQRNRVAVKGSLDLANKKFNNVTFAVVDSNGCIVNSETVDGPFENPEVKDVGVIERTVVRPLIRFFETKCEFFYDGAVQHPTGG